MRETAYDPTDPHGFHAEDAHHGHHVVSGRTLVGVLAALLFFTALTVTFSRVEVWAGDALNMDIPHWVNVVGAMSIAVIKGTLVLLYFMQLRYDNPLNAIIFLFCLFTLGLFLGLTTLDLGSRGMVIPWKDGEIVAGGNSVGLVREEGGVAMTGNRPIFDWAKQARPAKLGAEAYAEEVAHHAATSHVAPVISDADHSRPRNGLTPGLFDAEAPDAGHGVHAESGAAPNGGEAPAEGGH